MDVCLSRSAAHYDSPVIENLALLSGDVSSAKSGPQNRKTNSGNRPLNVINFGVGGGEVVALLLQKEEF